MMTIYPLAFNQTYAACEIQVLETEKIRRSSQEILRPNAHQQNHQSLSSVRWIQSTSLKYHSEDF